MAYLLTRPVLAAPKAQRGRAAFFGAGSRPSRWSFLRCSFALTPHRFCLFAHTLLRGFLVAAARLEFTKQALALHLLLQNPQSLVDIVVSDKYLQKCSPVLVAEGQGLRAHLPRLALNGLSHGPVAVALGGVVSRGLGVFDVGRQYASFERLALHLYAIAGLATICRQQADDLADAAAQDRLRGTRPQCDLVANLLGHRAHGNLLKTKGPRTQKGRVIPPTSSRHSCASLPVHPWSEEGE
ncbi:hypothetical protein BHMPCIPO_04790 [Ensifer sesbaniae]|nr:hypothetical protein [Ensifer sesbaniae]